ncbi:MAG: DNA gyrase inhibitor YacG [Proteobacteria bacterium]|nr:DNA gyrase inhibitor YacG [Pseudomonadota bacterium]
MSASEKSPTIRTVRCPACGGASRYAVDNPWRPFCSERCKNMDFGAWASEQYRVATTPITGEETDDPSAGASKPHQPAKH